MQLISIVETTSNVAFSTTRDKGPLAQQFELVGFIRQHKYPWASLLPTLRVSIQSGTNLGHLSNPTFSRCLCTMLLPYPKSNLSLELLDIRASTVHTH